MLMNGPIGSIVPPAKIVIRDLFMISLIYVDYMQNIFRDADLID